MASFLKVNGLWRAQVCVNRKRRSKSFATKAKAQAWAEIEEKLLAGTADETTSLGQVFQRYSDEVSVGKDGKKFEQTRIKHFIETYRLASRPIGEVTDLHWIGWRDDRLKQVQGSTVTREINLWSAIYTHAMKEWHIVKINPFASVSRPPKPPPRKQRVRDGDLEAILKALDYRGTGRSIHDRIAMALLFSIETAMRSGEVCSAVWGDLTSPKVLHLPKTKNGDERDVPLSTKAREILAVLKPLGLGDKIFGLNAGTRDTYFRKALVTAGLSHIHYHDSRREATTRLAKKVPVEMLAKITGHRDINLLHRVYYAPDMKDVADQLD